MSEESKDFTKALGGLAFVDQLVDGVRKVGESLKVQELIDDALYMAGKYALEMVLNTALKFTIEGKPDLTANRGVMFATLSSNPVDIALMSQVAPKKMAFVIDKEYKDAPVLKSLFKAFGVIADIDELIAGDKDEDIFNWIRRDRKMLSVVVSDKSDEATIEKAFEKVLKLSRDGFCPVIPVGIAGSVDMKPGATLLMRLGDKSGVNQSTKDGELPAMAKDFVERVRFLKS